jgi:glycerol-3-phosphate O-acyltransferase
MLEVPSKYQQFLYDVAATYRSIIADAGLPPEKADQVLGEFLWAVGEHVLHPFEFEPYHRLITEPFDYYRFGLEFFRPLVDKAHSTLTGRDRLQRITAQLAGGENVIFLANHQSEADPQIISLLLEDEWPDLGKEMIFVAGERVIADPMTAPFSMGRNLLCIYSKRHIEHPPDRKAAKILHNRKTMERMAELLGEGGHAIYVAPSGGRDRPNADGVVEVAKFDAQNIEMFRLMAQRAGRPAHFYPMALATYDIMPPPEKVETELGEPRRLRRGPVHLAIGEELDFERFADADRDARRLAQAQAAWEAVRNAYEQFRQPSGPANSSK